MIRNQISPSRLTMYQSKSKYNLSVVANCDCIYNPLRPYHFLLIHVFPPHFAFYLLSFLSCYLFLYFKTFFLPNHSPMG